MVAPTPYFSDRGCHVQIYEVARSQRALGNDVRIVTYHLGRDVGGIPTVRTPRVPWYRKREAGPSGHKLYLDLLLLAQTFRVALAFRPHLIHAHLHEGAAISLPVARLLKIPVLLDLQGSLTGELINHRFLREGGLAHRLMRGVEGAIHRHVDGMLMWAYLRDSLAGFSLDPEKIFPLNFGVDLEDFHPHARATLDDLHRKLALPRGRRIVVSLGLLNSYQGTDCLLRSIPRVLDRYPDCHFLIMGYPNEDRYRAMAARLGVADHVTVPGRIPYAQAARYLSLGDVAVAAKLTTREGNGKLLNYIACGLPTVAFDLPGNVATLGDAGVYAPCGDEEGLARAIAGLLADGDRRRDLAVRTRALAARYSWTAIGPTIDAAYDQLITRRRRPSYTGSVLEPARS